MAPDGKSQLQMTRDIRIENGGLSRIVGRPFLSAARSAMAIA